MKLISMTDFVLEQEQRKRNGSSVFKETIFEYAKFLKQPLTLGMFVPCDLQGNILEEPIPFDCTDKQYSEWCKAKERVLFMGFYLSNENKNVCIKTIDNTELRLSCNYANHVIEDLIKYNLKITESAIKQLGL